MITTHSPDLLDNNEITAEQLLAVSAVDGKTTIGRVDAASRQALRDSLFRAGELLRSGQLEPDEASLEAVRVAAWLTYHRRDGRRP